MKKRLKLLSMLLISAIMINVLSPMRNVNAEVSEIIDVPEYSPNLKEEEYAKESDFLNGDIIVNEENNGKIMKVYIPEYSYVKFYLKYSGVVSLYENENLEDKIVEGHSIDVFLVLPHRLVFWLFKNYL